MSWAGQRLLSTYGETAGHISGGTAGHISGGTAVENSEESAGGAVREGNNNFQQGKQEQV